MSESVAAKKTTGLAWLCTSQGLVIADKSHAVIIIALWKKTKIVKIEIQNKLFLPKEE